LFRLIFNLLLDIRLIVKTKSIGKFDGIVGQVRGNAQIIGYHQFVVDACDPLPKGYLI
jgi:proline racemase